MNISSECEVFCIEMVNITLLNQQLILCIYINLKHN